MRILPIMHRCLLLSLIILLTGSCQEDETLDESPSDCSLQGTLNGNAWCGQIFEIFLDDQGSMVVNASRPSTQENVDVEQITFYLPDFQVEGTYQLEAEGALYREWISDMLIICAKSQNQDTDQVTVDSYDETSGKIRGTVTFLAETPDSLYRFEQGTFEGVVKQ